MASDVYPLPQAVRPIGAPYAGSHSKAYNRAHGSDNWESENAVDLPTPVGTPIYAVAAGTIGPQIGSLNSSDPRMAGLRLHLVTGNNEYYYAHLSKLAVHAGEQVQAGQLLGYSGSARGIAHLHFAAKTGDPRSAFGSTFSSSATASSPTPTSAATTASTTAADQTVPGTGTSGPADTPTGPNLAETPPPTAQPLPGGGVSLPGSVRIVAPQVADLWQQVASQNMVSPDTQALLANASLASGG